jgi:hypothetical protein
MCAVDHSLGLFSSIKWQNQIGFISFLNLALLQEAELQWLALLFFTHATNTGFYTKTRENKENKTFCSSAIAFAIGWPC